MMIRPSFFIHPLPREDVPDLGVEDLSGIAGVATFSATGRICCGESMTDDQNDCGRRFDDLTSGRIKPVDLADVKQITQSLRMAIYCKIEDEVLTAMLVIALWDNNLESGGPAFIIPGALEEEQSALQVLLLEQAGLSREWHEQIAKRVSFLQARLTPEA